MRMRLNTHQMKMLLDGKTLRSGRYRFGLPRGENSEVRDMLQKFVDYPNLLDEFSVLVDVSRARVEIEKKDSGEYAVIPNEGR